MIFVAFIFISYLFLTSSFVYGNLKLRREPQVAEIKRETSVSIIIPFRNENKKLSFIFKCLQAQNYPYDLTEIIFVDDYSTDNGAILITQLIHTDKRFKVLKNNFEQGKKQALQFGIQQAKNSLILTSDADCSFGVKWIESMVAVYEFKKPHLLVGPVKLCAAKSIFGALLEVEFSALIASTAGAIGIDRAFMCNGANLAFPKKLFLELNPYEKNKNIASGDDVFLLHQIKSVYQKMAIISFVNNPDALVYSEAASTFKEFFYQRIRWSGKSKSYKDHFSIFVAFSVFLMNSLLLLLMFRSCFSNFSILHFFFIFLTKWLLDLTLLHSALTWLKPRKLFFTTFFLSIIYPFYIVSIALLSLLVQPKWKGMKI